MNKLILLGTLVLVFQLVKVDAQYYPVPRISLGFLPEFPNETKTYQFKDVPDEATEVLVYTFVTTNGEGEFQRGYYEMCTTQFPKSQYRIEYKQYMNVATGQGVMAVNSANMWLPKGDGKLKVKLIHPGDKKRSIAGKTEEHDQDWSKVFIIGYGRA